MNTKITQGGCLCGLVRYEATGPAGNVTHCHCSDCRRHSGAPFVTWATFPRSDLRFITVPPRELEWAGRRRSFCPRCGTPLVFLDAPESGEIEVTVGSFDDPTSVTPIDHTWTEDQLPWIQLADGLPTHQRARPASAV